MSLRIDTLTRTFLPMVGALGVALGVSGIAAAAPVSRPDTVAPKTTPAQTAQRFAFERGSDRNRSRADDPTNPTDRPLNTAPRFSFEPQPGTAVETPPQGLGGGHARSAPRNPGA